MANVFRRVGVGLYEDARRSLHFDVREMLAHYGFADTPANRDILTQAAIDACRAAWPDARCTIIENGVEREA